jgi:hypothetical protein
MNATYIFCFVFLAVRQDSERDSKADAREIYTHVQDIYFI